MNSDIYNNDHITWHGNTGNAPRSYKCPKCGGEFNNWKTYNKFHAQEYRGCPFCGEEQGQYNEDDNRD